jgi:hypothetical protein
MIALFVLAMMYVPAKYHHEYMDLHATSRPGVLQQHGRWSSEPVTLSHVSACMQHISVVSRIQI